jgi:hypothetical protein
MTISGIGYELRFVGAQRETIVNGKLAAALDLRTLPTVRTCMGSARSISCAARRASSKSTPQKIIADGTDWRFLNELKRELKT